MKQTNEYTYNNNGYLTKYLNRGISEIQYNYLNLPSKVILSDGSTVTYIYAVNGTKLRTVHAINGVTTTTDYCENVEETKEYYTRRVRIISKRFNNDWTFYES